MIRAVIIFVAGLMPLLFPKQVNSFQNYFLKKIHINYRIWYGKKYYQYTGLGFIIVSMILFVYSISI